MPRVIFTHPVEDVDHWTSKHSERVEAFSAWGSNVVDHVSADGSKNVAVSVDVHDMDTLKTSMESPDIAQAKKAHGVVDPVVMFVEHG